MEINNGTNRSCTHGDEMLSYLYNELSPEAREQFEAHLEVCFECVDEFAELAVSRYSVFEWKSIEFVPMATPKFVIPTAGPEPASASWFDSMRAAFAWNGWALAGGAAAIMLFAVIGISLWNVQPDATVADNDAVPSIEIAPITTKTVDAPAESETSELSETTKNKPPEAFQPEPVTPRRSASVNRIPNVSKVPAGRSRPVLTETRRPATSERLASSPTLGQYVEDQDDSLRLSDIFDDLDTRDME